MHINQQNQQEDLEGGEAEDSTSLDKGLLVIDKSGGRDSSRQLLVKKSPDSRSITSGLKSNNNHSPASRIDKEHQEIVHESAKEIVAGTELINKPIRHKTLYYGLKMNTPRNVAIVHPLMFTTRRIVYALIIVLIAALPLLGVWISLIGTLGMLGYALLEW